MSRSLKNMFFLFVAAMAGCSSTADVTGDLHSPPVLVNRPTRGDVEPIFDKFCGYCHRTNGIAEQVGIRMHLTAGQSLSDTINQPSQEVPDQVLVLPGNADESYLFQKVTHDLPAHGLRMPAFREPLSDENIELLRRWIDAGAPLQ